ncbi:hypothetical protein AAFO92_13045 [Roseovarius sp. CAU 1744]
MASNPTPEFSAEAVGVALTSGLLLVSWVLHVPVFFEERAAIGTAVSLLL